MLAFIPGVPGHLELIIIVAVFLLLFGSTRLPSLMRSIGRSVNEFKAGLSDKPGPVEDSKEDQEEAEPKQQVEEKVASKS